MKRNQFVMSYFGNKRTEVKNILDDTNLEGITTIVEPFCGSSALSFYIHTLYPKKYKFVLNDNDPNLVALYKILKDEKKTLKFQEKVNKMMTQETTKDEYKAMVKKKDVYGWFVGHKWYNIRHGLFPQGRKVTPAKLVDHPFCNFLMSENVKICQKDAIEVYEKYKKKKDALIFLDPPYLQCENDFYDKEKYNINIYEYLSRNNIKNEKANVVICLENNWIIKLLFRDMADTIITYDKKYQTTKKKTKHMVANNRKKIILQEDEKE